MKTFSSFLARFLLTGCLCWLFSTSQGRADVTFYDGTFNNADWAETHYTNGNGGSSSATQIGSGGNGGSYYQVTTSVNSGPACGAGIYLRNAFTYSPTAQGAIYNIDYAVDLYAFSLVGEAEPVASQNGMIYFGPEIYITTAGWQTVMETNLMATDFVKLITGAASGELGADRTSHPDFSANGAPIVFGFIVPDSTLSSSYTTIGGVDNYTLTVHVAGRLNISCANNLVTLSWLASTNPVFNLQSTPTLTPPGWSAVTNTPVLNGEFYFMTNRWTNQNLFFRLIQNVPATADGMALIPAGSYMIGDTLDGISSAIPTNVYVSAFFMDTNLVRYDLWQSVYSYATSHGYGFDDAGYAKATNHPAGNVNWYDAVKWCNARSQQAGLTPVYYTDAGFTQVYTNGDIDITNANVNWSANGYRLPTSAEWEKAARGGLTGQRFPWGLTISESQANYDGNTNNFYDLGPEGSNTNYNTGYPYTSPVGAFAANGYGLYDMAGNMNEWCWDWYAAPSYPAGSPYLGGTDPRGPLTESIYYRVTRGGGWSNEGAELRCAFPNAFPPNAIANGIIGFRCVRNLPTTTTDGMALIPAGSFTIGDTLDGESDAIPTNVYVSAFYMDTNLVSYGQWKPVYNYAIGQGYGFDSPGSGKADNQPVCSTVDWYDSAKWCNARSQQAGLTPVYYTDAGMTQVYTNGDVDALYPDWSANGYRLPTEAEWEKAARGGLSGQRFPWGNTISESQANYSGNTETYSYDLGPDGANTNFNSGYPYTSPVGYFAPNGYGLYDMAGNLFEWCWDWYATPPYPAGSPYLGGTDPRGPAANTGARVQRTGAWNNPANYQRCCNRQAFYPNYGNGSFGFRCVRNY